jgi:hypothetical protein
LVIPETRHAPPGKSNIFAIVEIKFPNDDPKEKQFTSYRELLRHAAKVKDAMFRELQDHASNFKSPKTPLTYMGQPVSSGGHLSLLRWPEDRAADPEPQEGDTKDGKKPHDTQPKEKKQRNRKRNKA